MSGELLAEKFLDPLFQWSQYYQSDHGTNTFNICKSKQIYTFYLENRTSFSVSVGSRVLLALAEGDIESNAENSPLSNTKEHNAQQFRRSIVLSNANRSYVAAVVKSIHFDESTTKNITAAIIPPGYDSESASFQPLHTTEVSILDLFPFEKYAFNQTATHSDAVVHKY